MIDASCQMVGLFFFWESGEGALRWYRRTHGGFGRFLGKGVILRDKPLDLASELDSVIYSVTLGRWTNVRLGRKDSES